MKDAKGHGSNPRGGGLASNSVRAFRAAMMLRTHYGQRDDDAQAAGALAQGHPKSAPVPTHVAMRFGANADHLDSRKAFEAHTKAKGGRVLFYHKFGGATA